MDVNVLDHFGKPQIYRHRYNVSRNSNIAKDTDWNNIKKAKKKNKN